MTETLNAEKFIDSKLRADALLMAAVNGRIFGYRVDTIANLPAVVFQQQDPGSDSMDIESNRILVNPLYIVKAICAGTSFLPIDGIANRIDAVLHKASGTAGTGQLWECYRERAFTMAEFNNGEDFRHLGGYYRMILSPA